jgi:C4-type Zn-finger protein
MHERHIESVLNNQGDFIMKQRQDNLQCPVCASAKYSKVQIELPEGEIYGADVFKCAKCSFRFLDKSRSASYLEVSYKTL